MNSAASKTWLPLALIFVAGFFGLATQALLFRRFFTVFEGTEISLAVFFSSWLFWGGAGAWLGWRLVRTRPSAVRHFDRWILLYLPAYLLQFEGVSHARALAGVASYELFPLAKLVLVCWPLNAPVSLVTGFLFVAACRWMSDRFPLAVPRVYLVETLGGFAGGAAVTAWLSIPWDASRIFLLCAAMLGTLSAWLSWRTRRGRLPWILPAVALALLAFRADEAWTRHEDRRVWSRFLPADAFEGHFATPQGRYLYGSHRGQFVVAAWESVLETYPDSAAAAEAGAIALSQVPTARRFLAAGPGAAEIGRRLASLPQVERIDWLPLDPGYGHRLADRLPEAFKPPPAVRICAEDARSFLSGGGAPYDAVLLSLPPATTLAHNRFLTVEFFRLIRKRMAPGGVVAVRIPSGENVAGEELSNAGASMYVTLSSVFPKVIAKPGASAWLLASEAGALSADPAELAARYSGIAGVETFYPPEGLHSLYPAGRASALLERFRAMSADGVDDLLNTDRRPLALFHSLLFAAKQAGLESLAGPAGRFASRGLYLLLTLPALYAVLRMLYRRRTRSLRGRDSGGGRAAPSRFDLLVLVAVAGGASLAFNLSLLHLYQSAMGSLFLQAGWLSAVFMLGLYLGGRFAVRLADHPLAGGIALPLAFSGATIALLTALAGWGAQAGYVGFNLLFLLGGVVSGAHVPWAAAQLNRLDEADENAAWRVWMADYAGGALGGLLVGLLLLPVTGLHGTWVFLGSILAAAILPLAPPRRAAAAAGSADPFPGVRPWAWSMTGVALFALAAGWWWRTGRPDPYPERLAQAARTMSMPAVPEAVDARRSDGRPVRYYRLSDAGVATNWLHGTREFAPDVAGYGGPLALAASVNREGQLSGVSVVQSSETPSYLELLRDWMERLSGRTLFGEKPLEDVDVVSGATMTSLAILDALRTAGPAFAVEILGWKIAAGPARAPPPLVDAKALWLAAGIALALVLRRYPNRQARLGFVALHLAVTGFLWNLQFSSAHVAALLAGRIPTPVTGAPFLLTVALPLVVLLAGNVYCGYLCPFGILQELAGRWIPERWTLRPSRRARRAAACLKYVLLFAIVLWLSAAWNPAVAAGDPMSAIFSRSAAAWVLAAGGLILAASIAVERFWCRNLCPAGAFLSLLNGVRLAGRLIPAVKPSACGFGVEHAGQLDCLRCDRCRENRGPVRIPSPVPGHDRIYVALALACFAAVAGMFWAEGERATRTLRTAGIEAIPASIRETDADRIRDLIRQGRLSDREALHYRAVE